MLIGYHLGEDHRQEYNGESALLKLVGASCHSFIDVGANVGDWTGLFLETGSKCGLLIEPSASAISRLQARFAKHTQLGLIHAAASDISGEMTFYDQGKAGEMSSLVATTEGEPTLVRVTTVDEEAANHGLESVDFLKIDAEGYDLHVLRGAVELLGKQRVGIVQFEYGASWAGAGSTLAAAIALLEGFGYLTFLLRTTGLHPYPYPKYGEFFSCSNFVGVSERQLPLVKSMLRHAI